MEARSQNHLEAAAAKWRYRFDIAARVLLLLVVMAIGGSLYLTVLSINRVQTLTQENQKMNKVIIENSQLLIDCTTPHGKCFESSQSRTADAVINLNQVTQAATVCADRPGSITLVEMDACIKSELTKAGE